MSDVLIFGIIGGRVSMIRSVVKTTMRLTFDLSPFFCAAERGLLLATDEQKKKVKALIGM